MREVVQRRYRKVLEDGGPFPDLILIDGGRGSCRRPTRRSRPVGLGNLVAVGIAKQEEVLFTRDRPEPIVLAENDPALLLVQRIRDEAHRFAVTFHRKARSMRDLRSELDDVPGIGPRRRRALLRRSAAWRASAAPRAKNSTRWSAEGGGCGDRLLRPDELSRAQQPTLKSSSPRALPASRGERTANAKNFAALAKMCRPRRGSAFIGVPKPVAHSRHDACPRVESQGHMHGKGEGMTGLLTRARIGDSCKSRLPYDWRWNGTHRYRLSELRCRLTRASATLSGTVDWRYQLTAAVAATKAAWRVCVRSTTSCR